MDKALAWIRQPTGILLLYFVAGLLIGASVYGAVKIWSVQEFREIAAPLCAATCV